MRVSWFNLPSSCWHSHFRNEFGMGVKTHNYICKHLNSRIMPQNRKNVLFLLLFGMQVWILIMVKEICWCTPIQSYQTRSNFGCFSCKHTAQTAMTTRLVVSLMICFSKSRRPVTSKPYALSYRPPHVYYYCAMKITQTQISTPTISPIYWTHSKRTYIQYVYIDILYSSLSYQHPQTTHPTIAIPCLTSCVGVGPHHQHH